MNAMQFQASFISGCFSSLGSIFLRRKENCRTATYTNPAAIWVSHRYMSKRSVGVRIVRMSLNLDDAIIKDRLTGNIQDINHFVQ